MRSAGLGVPKKQSETEMKELRILTLLSCLAFAACSGGSGSADGSGPVTNEPQNSPPSASIDGPENVDAEDSFTLDGASSFDPDGDSLTFEWSQLAGPTVYISDRSSPSIAVTAPIVGEPTIIRFRLSVRDPSGAVSSDDFELTIQPRDLRPTVELATKTLNFSSLEVPGIPGLALIGAGVSTALGDTAPIIGGNATIEIFNRTDQVIFLLDLSITESVPVYLAGGAAHSGIITWNDIANGFLYIQATHFGSSASDFDRFLSSATTLPNYESLIRVLQAATIRDVDGDGIPDRDIDLFDTDVFEQQYAAVADLAEIAFGEFNPLTGTPWGVDPLFDALIYYEVLFSFGLSIGIGPEVLPTAAAYIAALSVSSLASPQVAAMVADQYSVLSDVLREQSSSPPVGPPDGPQLFQTETQKFRGEGRYNVRNPRHTLFAMQVDGSYVALVGARDSLIESLVGLGPWESDDGFFSPIPEGEYDVHFSTGFSTRTTGIAKAAGIGGNVTKLLCKIVDSLPGYYCPLSSDSIARGARILKELETSGLTESIAAEIAKKGSVSLTIEAILRRLEPDHIKIFVDTRGVIDSETRKASFRTGVARWIKIRGVVKSFVAGFSALDSGLPLLSELFTADQDIEFCAILDQDLMLNDEETIRQNNPDFVCGLNTPPTARVSVANATDGNIDRQPDGSLRATLGTRVTYDAGGSSDDRTPADELLYKFELQDEFFGVVEVLQDFSSSSVLTYTHDRLGIFRVRVTVRDGAGQEGAAAVQVDVIESGIRITSPSSSSVGLAPLPIDVEIDDPRTADVVTISVNAVQILSTTEIPLGGRISTILDPAAFGFQDGDSARIEARVLRNNGEAQTVAQLVTFGTEFVLPGPGQGRVRIQGTWTESVLNANGEWIEVERSRNEDLDATVTVAEGRASFSDQVRRLIAVFDFGQESINVTTRGEFGGPGTYEVIRESDGVVSTLGIPVFSQIALEQCFAESNGGIIGEIPSGQLTVSDYDILEIQGSLESGLARRQATVNFQMSCTERAFGDGSIRSSFTVTGVAVQIVYLTLNSEVPP